MHSKELTNTTIRISTPRSCPREGFTAVIIPANKITSALLIIITITSSHITWIVGCAATPVKVVIFTWWWCWCGSWDVGVFINIEKLLCFRNNNNFLTITSCIISRRINTVSHLTASETERSVIVNHSIVERSKVFFAASRKFIDCTSRSIIHQTIHSCADVSLTVISNIVRSSIAKVMRQPQCMSYFVG